MGPITPTPTHSVGGERVRNLVLPPSRPSRPTRVLAGGTRYKTHLQNRTERRRQDDQQRSQLGTGQTFLEMAAKTTWAGNQNGLRLQLCPFLPPCAPSLFHEVHGPDGTRIWHRPLPRGWGLPRTGGGPESHSQKMSCATGPPLCAQHASAILKHSVIAIMVPPPTSTGNWLARNLVTYAGGFPESDPFSPRTTFCLWFQPSQREP